jgi:hypothetical protein
MKENTGLIVKIANKKITKKNLQKLMVYIEKKTK